MPRTWIFSSAPKRGCLSKSGETGYRTGICVILSSIMENHALCGARGAMGVISPVKFSSLLRALGSVESEETCRHRCPPTQLTGHLLLVPPGLEKVR